VVGTHGMWDHVDSENVSRNVIVGVWMLEAPSPMNIYALRL
jgi:hypothetical protein